MKKKLNNPLFFGVGLNESGIFEYKNKRDSTSLFIERLARTRFKKTTSSNRETIALEIAELNLLDLLEKSINKLLIETASFVRHELLDVDVIKKMVDVEFEFILIEVEHIIKDCFKEGEEDVQREVLNKSLFSLEAKGIKKVMNFFKTSIEVLKAHINQDLSMIIDLPKISEKEVKKEIIFAGSKWYKKCKILSHSVTQKSYDEGKVNAYQILFPNVKIKVFKQPEYNACRKCVELYVDLRTGKPKIFELNKLIQNGSNYGKPQRDWKAVVGDTHPFCNCSLKFSKR